MYDRLSSWCVSKGCCVVFWLEIFSRKSENSLQQMAIGVFLYRDGRSGVPSGFFPTLASSLILHIQTKMLHNLHGGRPDLSIGLKLVGIGSDEGLETF